MHGAVSCPKIWRLPNTTPVSGTPSLAVILVLLVTAFILPLSPVGAATPETGAVSPTAVEKEAAFSMPKCPVQCCHDFGCKEMESDLDCKAMIQARLLCPSSDHKVYCGEKVCYCRQ